MGLVAGLGAGLASGVMGLIGGQQQISAQQGMVNQQEAFQEQMSNSAYQRSVQDMRAAGLNPDMMMASGGGPETTPTGAGAALPNVLGTAGAQAINSGLAAAQASKTMDVQDAQLGLMDSQDYAANMQAKQSFSQSQLLDANTAMAEMKNKYMEADLPGLLKDAAQHNDYSKVDNWIDRIGAIFGHGNSAADLAGKMSQ